MSKTGRSDQSGAWCGRAARGLSKLSNENWREIEAHRARERPTPWRVLADRYDVPEADLRMAFEGAQAVSEIVLAPVPVSPPWTAEEDAKLRTLFLDYGLSRGPIAVALGRTDASVKHRLDQLGIRRSTAPPSCPQSKAA